MKSINLTASKETGYLVEKDESKLLEYALMYPLIAIAFVLGAKVYAGEFKYETGPTERMVFIILFMLVLIMTAFSLHQIKSVKKLTFIKLKLKKEETRTAIRDLAIEQEWKINYDNGDCFKAETKSGILVGKEITIIYASNGFFYNVRLCQSLYGRFPFTFGKKKLFKQLENRIKHHITKA